jgi:sodium-independent sulfate anion transporter 11
MANLFSPFVGGYVCTGSFGASAVLSKAGVRTPLAGLFSAFILILALYALTSVFYYIPMAALAGLIIHAVCNLATPPRQLYKYWQLSPFEFLIWVAGVAIALFTSLEVSIYSTIGLSFFLLLLQLSRTDGRFMGVITARQIYTDEEECTISPTGLKLNEKSTARTAFLPLDRKDNSNPKIAVDSPYPGVFIYRFTDGFSYINQARYMDQIMCNIKKRTRRTRNDDGLKSSDRLWSDPGPVPGNENATKTLPLLRAVVLDFSAVNNIDITSIQGLIDLRNSLDRHASPAAVEWHFAGVLNRWTRRALAVSGFGFPSADFPEALGRWSPVYLVAGIGGADAESLGDTRSSIFVTEDSRMDTPTTLHSATWPKDESKAKSYESVQPVDRPFFHIDLLQAVDVAIHDATKKDAVGEGLMY